MPCTYYTPDEERSMALSESERLRKELDEVTRMLCETCDDLEHALIPGRSTLERVRGLQDWWNKHQALDFQRKRAEQEKQKQEALLSLRAEIDRTESQIKQIRKLGGEPTTKKLKQLETLMQKLARQK